MRISYNNPGSYESWHPVARYPVSLGGPSQDPCAEDISPLGGSHTVQGPGRFDEFNPVASPSPVLLYH